MLKRTVTIFCLIVLLSMSFSVETKAQASDYPDIHWKYIGGENGLGEIIFAQDKYITVGYNGIKVSYDLEVWNTIIDLSDEEQYIYGGWPAIEYNGSIFVITGLSGGIYTSSDGMKWLFHERPFDFDISEIIWDGNQFVAVGQYGRDEFHEDKRPAGIITSSNGLDWTKLDVEFDMPWGLGHIAYNGKVYVADGITEIFYSYDLMKWEQCDIYGYNEGIEWVKDRFIATRGGNNILYSYDGIKWQNIEQSWDNTMFACAYNGNIFVAVGLDGTIYVSYDGLNWICKTEWGRIDNDLYDVIWTGERFVILGGKSNLTWVPDDIIKVTVNGEYITFDQSPIIINGRTLVPIRAVCEKLGADVYWLEPTQGVLVVKNEIKLTLTIGKNQMVRFTAGSFSEYFKKAEDKNYKPEEIYLDVPPQIIGDRTLLPIRAICEALGAEVDWNDETKTVVIACSEEIINDKNRDKSFYDELVSYKEDADRDR